MGGVGRNENFEQTMNVFHDWPKSERSPQLVLISRTQYLLLWGGPNLVWFTACPLLYPTQQCLADWWIALARMISLLPSLPTSELHSLILIHGDMEDKALAHTQLDLYQPLHSSQYWWAIYFHTTHYRWKNSVLYICTNTFVTPACTCYSVLWVAFQHDEWFNKTGNIHATWYSGAFT